MCFSTAFVDCCCGDGGNMLQALDLRNSSGLNRLRLYSVAVDPLTLT